MNDDGTAKIALSVPGPAADDRHPSICSKARKVVFDRDEGPTADIWIMNKDGASPLNISDVGVPSANAVRPDCGVDGLEYPATNEVVAFANGTDKKIWTMNLDGTSASAEVAPLGGAAARDPGWCFNQGILFARPSGTQGWCVPGQATMCTNISQCATGQTCHVPAQHRIYSWDTEDNTEIQRTTDPNTLPNQTYYEHRFPGCSSRGEFLIYERVSYQGGEDPELEEVQHADTYRVDVDPQGIPPATNLTQCYNQQASYYASDYPDLSPGSNYVVFRHAGYGGTDPDYEIVKAPADACDAGSGQYPIYLTGCAQPTDPWGTPVCGPLPHDPKDNDDADTDPEWGEM